MTKLIAALFLTFSRYVSLLAIATTPMLCIGADGNTLRGSCTDKNWASPECAMYCLGADRGGTDLILCLNVTGSDTSFCCDHNPGCCNSGVGRFAVLPSNPKGRCSSTEPPQQLHQLLRTRRLWSHLQHQHMPLWPVKHASSPASDTPALPDEPTGISTGVKAGIGAGVGVGAVLVMTVVYLMWRIRKNKKATEKEKQLPSTYYGPGTDASWQQHHYELGVKEFTPQPPQELHGQALPGYNVRAELPANN
ncbi:hypothetical protein FSST1_009020 [Fusarium sambucinum]